MPALDTPCCTCVAEIESVEHSARPAMEAASVIISVIDMVTAALTFTVLQV